MFEVNETVCGKSQKIINGKIILFAEFQKCIAYFCKFAVVANKSECGKSRSFFSGIFGFIFGIAWNKPNFLKKIVVGSLNAIVFCPIFAKIFFLRPKITQKWKLLFNFLVKIFGTKAGSSQAPIKTFKFQVQVNRPAFSNFIIDNQHFITHRIFVGLVIIWIWVAVF